MKKALIVWGGWDGHQPREVADIFRGILQKEQFEVEVANTLQAFADAEKLKSLDHAFRENVDWQFVTEGQWVAHPGNDGVIAANQSCFMASFNPAHFIFSPASA